MTSRATPGVKRVPVQTKRPKDSSASSSSFNKSTPQVQSASGSPNSSSNGVSNSSSYGVTSSETSSFSKSAPAPLVMTPVSQISGGKRRVSRVSGKSEDSPVAFDPEHYNPDGSLRTKHRMPVFDQSYAQAMSARYIRHPKKLDRETELSIHQIFDKK